MMNINKEKIKKFQQQAKLKTNELSARFIDLCKRNKQISISAAIIIAGILITIIMIELKKKPAKVSYPDLAPLVKTEILKPRDIEMVIKGYGTVKPRSAMQIVPQISGKIVSMNPQFRAGGIISAGEQLFEIEPKDFELAVEQAQANVAEMEVKLDIEKSEAAVAKREWGQINPGTEPNSALVLREPQIRQAQAQLFSAKAALAKAELDLARTSITLPIEVCVTEKNVDLGQFVMSGHVAGRAYGIDAVEIEVPLEDDELAWFALPGSEAKVIASFAGEEKIFNGEIKRTTGRVDETSRLIYVVVEVRNPVKRNNISDSLMPGTFVTVSIKGKVFENAYAVKRDWVHNGDELWVVNGDTLNIKTINVVRTDDEYAYIKLNGDETIKVVASSIDAVVDGMKVRVAQESQ